MFITSGIVHVLTTVFVFIEYLLFPESTLNVYVNILSNLLMWKYNQMTGYDVIFLFIHFFSVSFLFVQIRNWAWV